MCGEVQDVQKYPAYLSLVVQPTEVPLTVYVCTSRSTDEHEEIDNGSVVQETCQSSVIMGKGIHGSDWLTGSSLQHCGELSPGQVKVLFCLSIVGLGSDQRVQI
jgi:hypothetical protein